MSADLYFKMMGAAAKFAKCLSVFWKINVEIGFKN